MMLKSWKNPLVSMFFCKNNSAVWGLRKRPIIGVGLMLDQGQSMLSKPDYPAITPCSPNSKPKWRASPSVRMLPCDDLPLIKKIEYISIAVNKQRERDVAQWLERGALPMSLPVAFGFKPRLEQDFQRNIMFIPSQYWDMMLYPFYPHMLHLTQVQTST